MPEDNKVYFHSSPPAYPSCEPKKASNSTGLRQTLGPMIQSMPQMETQAVSLL